MKIENQDCLIDTLKALKIIKEAKINKKIDLSEISKITPFFITPISAFLKENTEFSIKYPSDPYKLFYLSVIKFPDCTNSTSIMKKSYTPLYEIKKELGNNEENEEILDLLEKIIIESFGLRNNYQLFMAVFNELICNIQQHSNSNFNCIQAQLYENKLAISLIDTGISIQESYRRSGFKGTKDNMEFFKLAFEGISTKEEKERGTGIPNSYNWICKGLNGNLVIISDNSAFKKVTNENIEFVDLSSLNLRFQGTIVNMLFEIPEEKIDIYPLMNKPLFRTEK